MKFKKHVSTQWVKKKAFMEIDLMLQSLCPWVPESEGVNDQRAPQQLGCLSLLHRSFQGSLHIIVHIEPWGACPASSASFQ